MDGERGPGGWCISCERRANGGEEQVGRVTGAVSQACYFFLLVVAKLPCWYRGGGGGGGGVSTGGLMHGYANTQVEVKSDSEAKRSEARRVK